MAPAPALSLSHVNPLSGLQHLCDISCKLMLSLAPRCIVGEVNMPSTEHVSRGQRSTAATPPTVSNPAGGTLCAARQSMFSLNPRPPCQERAKRPQQTSRRRQTLKEGGTPGDEPGVRRRPAARLRAGQPRRQACGLLLRRQPRHVRGSLSPSRSACVGRRISALTCGVSPKRSIAVRGRPLGSDAEFSMSCDIVVPPGAAAEVAAVVSAVTLSDVSSLSWWLTCCSLGRSCGVASGSTRLDCSSDGAIDPSAKVRCSRSGAGPIALSA